MRYSTSAGVLALALLLTPLTAAAAALQPADRLPRTINRAEYEDRLRAMWLGQSIANWTGLRTEGQRTEPPFYTDADWGTTPPGATLPIDFVLNQDPWLADDDTDIEYVYLHLMSRARRPLLAPPEIRAGWLLHMNPQYIWVSNHRAWSLMHRGMAPPDTSLPAANELWAHIDAQLTTEFFGALTPGMPERGLQLGELPIRTTAFGFSAHAAQYFLALYTLASAPPASDPTLSGHERALWLAREARRWIPDSSKSAAAVDLVIQDFLANPDLDDWERTRDLVYQVFQQNTPGNGYFYRGWTESTVNFASGIIALLYGGCDYRRTVQIGTLSGWDSDNATATLGGMLGLMLGMEQLRAQFPGQTFSDRYRILNTRQNLPDYLPADPWAQDTFTMMARRMMPLIDRIIVDAGGSIDKASNTWVLPARINAGHIAHNPGFRAQQRSANNTVRAAGGLVLASATIAAAPPWPPWAHGAGDAGLFANGFEHDWRGLDLPDHHRYFYSTRGGSPAPGAEIWLSVTYDRPVTVAAIRFIEGDHFPEGGWFESANVQLLIGGQWQSVSAEPSEPLDALRPFQIIDFNLPSPRQASGIRIGGVPGGSARFITCLELDAMSGPAPPPGRRQP
jgi:hypothetical protein